MTGIFDTHSHYADSAFDEDREQVLAELPEKGVKLVSGASANIFANVVSGDLKVVTPYDFMLQMLEPYAEFDKVTA